MSFQSTKQIRAKYIYKCNFRFLANEYNLAGRTNLEKAQADEIVDTIVDILDQGGKAMYEKNENEKKAKGVAFIEKTAEVFGKLESRLDGRGGQFFAGNSLTWADLQLFFCIEFVNRTFLQGKSDCAAKFSLLKNLNLRVGNLPNIKNWMENRPKTPY